MCQLLICRTDHDFLHLYALQLCVIEHYMEIFLHLYALQYFDCNLHLCLVSHSSKVMLKVILNRLKAQAEEIIAEEQAGFRAGRSITEQIFNLGILCKKTSNTSRICTMSSLISKKPLTEYGMQPYEPPFGSTISVQI